jgi:hypothetical protein
VTLNRPTAHESDVAATFPNLRNGAGEVGDALGGRATSGDGWLYTRTDDFEVIMIIAPASLPLVALFARGAPSGTPTYRDR